jgi:hypothetical protein
MGETAASGTGGSEVDADVVQVSAPPDIGSVVHPAPSYDQHLDWHCVECLYRLPQSRC